MLVGEKGIDLLGKIFENKHQILKDAYNEQLNQLKQASSSSSLSGKHQNRRIGLSFRSTQENDIEKKLKKEEKQLRQQQQGTRETQYNVGGFISSSSNSHPSHQKKELPKWLEHVGSILQRPNDPSTRRAVILKIFSEELPQANVESLPEETKRIVRDGYEEYHIPPVIPENDGFKLLPITVFDAWAQPAFKGYSHLNKVQSKVFYRAYHTNENLLICAPTGCGKTLTALTAILREIGQHYQDGVLRKEEFKIIYIAPMKALAQEMVTNFSQRLQPLGLQVRELTGDMQLTKKEIQATQMIITTPEKWDVITRKAGDQQLAQLVKLLIIDEVHLLAEDRGPVVESIVARTLRQIESSQSMIRIVGLSATLPNYLDVATFLRVNPQQGLFYFDNSYRPVPLSQQYIGVTETNKQRQKQMYNEICYQKVVESLTQGNQVMVFVHSRKETATTAFDFLSMAQEQNDQNAMKLFQAGSTATTTDRWSRKEIESSRNYQLKDLLPHGFAIHHAGMIRSDRTLVEKLFTKGHVKVLFCTATLAWGMK